MRAAFALCLMLASSAFAEDFKLTLENPGMETGAEIPEGWRGKFGKAVVARDTTIVHSGSASLSVQNAASGSVGAHQMIAVKPGLKLKIRGWVRGSVGSKASFAAQFFNDKFTWNEFLVVKSIDGFLDWQEAEKEITVPEHASRMAIALYVEGVGQAWLDDVALTAEGAVVEARPPSSNPLPPQEPADVSLVPTTPLPGYFPQHPKAWMAYHESHLRRAKQGGIDVLFLGDSITQGWNGAGKDIWNKHFAPLNAANFGIGGDKTGNVLWRIQHGLTEGLAPKVVVLMIGVNNVWSGKNNGEQIAAGIKAIVEKLRSGLPQAKVLVLGVLPIGPTADDTGRARVKDINTHAALLDDGATVKYVDLGPKLLQKNGKLLEGAYTSDHLHLTAKGYEVLAKDLSPVVAEIVKQATIAP